MFTLTINNYLPSKYFIQAVATSGKNTQIASHKNTLIHETQFNPSMSYPETQHGSACNHVTGLKIPHHIPKQTWPSQKSPTGAHATLVAKPWTLVPKPSLPGERFEF